MFDFLTEKFSTIFSSLTGKSRLTEENLSTALEQVKNSLLEADIDYDTVCTFVDEVAKEVVGQKVIRSVKPSDQFIKIIHDRMVAFLGGQYGQETFTFQIPSVILMMGLQGSGKTTTVGKLAYFIKNQASKRGKTVKILCASVDFYRPAAIDQLEIVSEQVHVDFYRATSGDVLQAVAEIYTYFKAHGYQYLLLDTAGRLQVDDRMIDELVAIKKIVQPKYSLMVLDAMTGQQSLSVAQSFQSKVGFDGAVLSKMDSQTRAGAAFAFRYTLKKPIFFIGLGEKFDQLEIFRPERIANRMLGLGDVVTLVEQVQDKIQKSDQDSLTKAFMSGDITLDDFAKQLQMVSKIGSLSSILKFMPGMGNAKISQAEVDRGDQELKKFKVILSSMTVKERRHPALLTNGSRKNRIAKGAGVKVEAVNLLLERFEQSKQFVKLLKKNRFF